MTEISDSVSSIIILDTPESVSPLPETPQPPGINENNQQDEENLFRHFRGWTYSERARVTTSWIWEQGFDIQRGNERKWVCRTCIRKRHPKPKSVAAGGTQNAENHLWEAHRVSDPSGKRVAEKQRKSDSKPILSIVDIFRLDPAKPREQAIANTLIKTFDRTHFQRLLVEWVVESNLSFQAPENKRLRAIFEYLNPSVCLRDAHISGNTVRKKAIEAYNRHKETVIEVLQKAPGLVHISFDGWRSRNRHAFFGITAFFRDENDKPCKIVLGVPEVSERHYGYNIAGEILDIIYDYEIDKKVGYFTLDNAENNDTAIEIIGAELGFNGRARRGRCFGYILNLAAKAILFGKNVEAFEEQLSGSEALSNAEHELWRKTGPVGKLHNLVVAINRSDILTYLLDDIQQRDIDASDNPTVKSKKPIRVIVDNDTRWLSQLYMIRRGLQLRDYFEQMIVKHKQTWERENKLKRGPGFRKGIRYPSICEPENQLDETDWKVLEIFAELLTVFEDAVKTLEGDGMVRKRKKGWVGSYGNPWDVIIGYEFLLGTLEKYKEMAATFPGPEHFRININLGWDKLEEYYSRLDETPIYYTALALHPAYRWDYFEEQWDNHPDWVAKAKEMVKDVWVTDYKPLEVVRSPENGPIAKRQKIYPNAFEAHRQKARVKFSSPRMSGCNALELDEYEAWVGSPQETDISIQDPIQYWHDLRFKYPRLSRMALDFLTIQPMSAECERLFSAAGLMVTPQRNRLEAHTIGICQVLRSWLRAGIIDELDPIFVSEEDEAIQQPVDVELDIMLEGYEGGGE
jgi:hAT family C-terminal dimerisation region